MHYVWSVVSTTSGFTLITSLISYTYVVKLGIIIIIIIIIISVKFILEPAMKVQRGSIGTALLLR